MIDTCFQTILCDPPWSFKTWGGKTMTPHRSANDHYATLSYAELSALRVNNVAAKNACLFMWIVDSHIPEGIQLAADWGFRFKTKAFTWLKSKNEEIPAPIGMGYWTRKQTEQVYLFTRGTPKVKSHAIREVIVAPRRQHSRKPDEIYNAIETLVDGPYLEMFARTTRRGWQQYGNEVEKFNATQRHDTR